MSAIGEDDNGAPSEIPGFPNPPVPETSTDRIVRGRSALLMLRTLANTPLLLLQIFFFWWIYVIVVVTPDGIGIAFLKALSMTAIVGSVHCTNAYYVWCENQRSYTAIQAQVAVAQGVSEARTGAYAPDTSLWSYIKSSGPTLVRFYIAPVCVSTYSYTMSADSDNFTFIFPQEKIWHFSAVEIGFLVCFAYFILMKWADYYFIHLSNVHSQQKTVGRTKCCHDWQQRILHHTSVGYTFDKIIVIACIHSEAPNENYFKMDYHD